MKSFANRLRERDGPDASNQVHACVRRHTHTQMHMQCVTFVVVGISLYGWHGMAKPTYPTIYIPCSGWHAELPTSG